MGTSELNSQKLMINCPSMKIEPLKIPTIYSRAWCAQQNHNTSNDHNNLVVATLVRKFTFAPFLINSLVTSR